MESSVLDHAIKVRKPYTITKQRERWTDEEHNKFLEALKLHGRAWRRIEEHIGTKTAVQIRSHAQKFFSKVVRESGGDSPSTVKTIEIPPPRPKRKPIHPYPRKLGHSLSNKAIPSSEQSDGSSSVSEQENKSPTSVLSAAGSGVFGPSLSNLPSSYASPSSSAAGPVPVGALMSEQENECQSASTSAEKDNRSPLPNPVPPGTTLQDKSDMELNLDADDSIPAKEASSTEAQTTSLKLFGRTFLVADSQKSSTGSIVQRQESLPAIETERHQRNIGLDLQFPARPSLQNTAEVEFSAGQPSHQSTAEVEFSAGEARSQWRPWTGGMPPMLYCLPSHGNIIPLPWWAFYSGLPFPVMSPQSMALQEEVMTSCREDTKDGDMQKESSLTGSNAASMSEVEMREKSGETTESLHTENSNSDAAAPALRLRTSGASAFTRLKVSSKKSTRGFMPYRRCVAESEVEHKEMASDKEDGQGMQLCL